MSVQRVNSADNPWIKLPLSVGVEYEHRIGPVRIKVKWDSSEILINWTQEDSAEPLPSGDAQVWHRWAFRQKSPVIEFKPVFPDKPVIVQPENPFRIAEDAEVRFYVRVPVWIRLTLKGIPATNLIDIPVVTLSNTWFGAFNEGDLCYWISSGARRSFETDKKRVYLAICPIRIIDKAPEDLDVRKICLRVANLSLYIDDTQLWASETVFTYNGMTDISDVHVGGKAPPEAPNAKLIMPPREVSKKTFSARSFESFRGWTGLTMFSR